MGDGSRRHTSDDEANYPPAKSNTAEWPDQHDGGMDLRIMGEGFPPIPPWRDLGLHDSGRCMMSVVAQSTHWRNRRPLSKQASIGISLIFVVRLLPLWHIRCEDLGSGFGKILGPGVERASVHVDMAGEQNAQGKEETNSELASCLSCLLAWGSMLLILLDPRFSTLT